MIEGTTPPPPIAHLTEVNHAGVEDAQVEVSEEGGHLKNAVLDRGQGTRATNEALTRNNPAQSMCPPRAGHLDVGHDHVRSYFTCPQCKGWTYGPCGIPWPGRLGQANLGPPGPRFQSCGRYLEKEKDTL